MKEVFLTVQRDLVMMLNMTVDTLLLRAVDCLYFYFFLVLSSSVVLSSKVKMSFAVLLIWGRGEVRFTVDF